MTPKTLHVLVTGATGFVGLHLCEHLLAQGYHVTALGRQAGFNLSHPHLQYHAMPPLEDEADYTAVLQGVDVVVHLAARVHCMSDKGMKSLSEYQAVNVRGTQRLVECAVKQQVKRFIYLSTIKVNGEQTHESAFRADDHPHPSDAYSLSKLQAEQIVQQTAKRSGMEWVIIRTPLVYGSGVKGNFEKLMHLARSQWPLPFRSMRRLRSFVSIQNLCDFITCCLQNAQAEREILLVSDGEDISVAQWIKLLRRSLDRRSGLFPFPLGLMKVIATLVGKRKQIERLIEPLQMNIEKSIRLLSWHPPYSVKECVQMLWKKEQI